MLFIVSRPAEDRFRGSDDFQSATESALDHGNFNRRVSKNLSLHDPLLNKEFRLIIILWKLRSIFGHSPDDFQSMEFAEIQQSFIDGVNGPWFPGELDAHIDKYSA